MLQSFDATVLREAADPAGDRGPQRVQRVVRRRRGRRDGHPGRAARDLDLRAGDRAQPRPRALRRRAPGAGTSGWSPRRTAPRCRCSAGPCARRTRSCPRICGSARLPRPRRALGEARLLLDLGVDGLITDAPDHAVRAVRELVASEGLQTKSRTPTGRHRASGRPMTVCQPPYRAAVARRRSARGAAVLTRVADRVGNACRWDSRLERQQATVDVAEARGARRARADRAARRTASRGCISVERPRRASIGAAVRRESPATDGPPPRTSSGSRRRTRSCSSTRHVRADHPRAGHRPPGWARRSPGRGGPDGRTSGRRLGTGTAATAVGTGRPWRSAVNEHRGRRWSGRGPGRRR